MLVQASPATSPGGRFDPLQVVPATQLAHLLPNPGGAIVHMAVRFCQRSTLAGWAAHCGEEAGLASRQVRCTGAEVMLGLPHRNAIAPLDAIEINLKDALLGP